MTDEGRKYLPYGRQLLDDEDIQAVVDVLRGDWLTTGPTVGLFEEKFREVVKSEYFVSCSSGTAALHLACMALDIGPGDRVIVPSISFVATANGALYCGADILFTDVDPATGLMRAQDLLDLINSLTPDELGSVAAIIPVNLAGEVVEIEAIGKIALEHGWKVIFDSCHALGTRYRTSEGAERNVGDCHFGHMEVFSFHPVKTIAMGEGGGVTTNDVALYDKLNLLRNHGIERDPAKWETDFQGEVMPPWYYEMQILGYNYRQSDIHSALGLSQLKKLPAFIAKRHDLVACYDELLTNSSIYITPLKKAESCTAVRHLYVIMVDFEGLGMTRTHFVNALSSRQVGTQVHYIPIFAHPYYVQKYGLQVRPNAEKYYAQAVSLPLHASMSRDDVAYVVDQIEDILRS